MMNYQSEKKLILDFYQQLDNSDPNAITKVLKDHLADNYIWRGSHPFNEQNSAESMSELFWQPLRQSLSHLQRRMDIFIAGNNEIDNSNSTWVISMGHLMGLFDRPWLNIPPTNKMAFLRYCEFNKVENGKISETAMFVDIPHFMMQAGLQPFPVQTAAHLVQPGPTAHDGLLFDQQSGNEGDKTLSAINFMVQDIRTWNSGQEMTLVEELRRSWNEDMIWWGPAGIGSTYTIERYAEQHSGPFRAGFGDRKFNGHLCKLAEGKFGGFFGWPNLTLTPTGGFMGMPATGKPGDMRVIDIYRREGNKLSENWVFIDLLHFWNQQGVDILSRLGDLTNTKDSVN
jgi:hypothetical protein